jgi:hypothetical protein
MKRRRDLWLCIAATVYAANILGWLLYAVRKGLL